jgi:hypothetical protein
MDARSSSVFVNFRPERLNGPTGCSTRFSIGSEKTAKLEVDGLRPKPVEDVAAIPREQKAGRLLEIKSGNGNWSHRLSIDFGKHRRRTLRR